MPAGTGARRVGLPCRQPQRAVREDDAGDEEGDVGHGRLRMLVTDENHTVTA